MTERLKRVVDEPSQHKILDLIFLGAISLGAINTFNAVRAIEGGQEVSGVYLFIAHMVIFSVAGVIGYFTHILKKIWWEFYTIVPIIAGYITLVVASIGTIINSPTPNPFVLSMSGILPALGLWFIIDATTRFVVIERRRKQILASKKIRKSAAQAITRKTIIAKAEEIENSEA